jgi:hypothetical protein
MTDVDRPATRPTPNNMDLLQGYCSRGDEDARSPEIARVSASKPRATGALAMLMASARNAQHTAKASAKSNPLSSNVLPSA